MVHSAPLRLLHPHDFLVETKRTPQVANSDASVTKTHVTSGKGSMLPTEEAHGLDQVYRCSRDVSAKCSPNLSHEQRCLLSLGRLYSGLVKKCERIENHSVTLSMFRAFDGNFRRNTYDERPGLNSFELGRNVTNSLVSRHRARSSLRVERANSLVMLDCFVLLCQLEE